MIKNVNAYHHSTNLAEGKGQKKYFKNNVKAENKWTNNIMDASQKDYEDYFGETIDFLKLCEV